MILKPSIGNQIMAQRRALESMNQAEEENEKANEQKQQATEAALIAANEKINKLQNELAQANAKCLICDEQINMKDAELKKAQSNLSALESKGNAIAFALEGKLNQANARITQEQKKCMEEGVMRNEEYAQRVIAEKLLEAERKARMECENRITLLMAELKKPVITEAIKPVSYTMQIASRDGNGGIRSMKLVPEE